MANPFSDAVSLNLGYIEDISPNNNNAPTLTLHNLAFIGPIALTVYWQMGYPIAQPYMVQTS